MPYRAGLHTMVDVLADNCAFEGRRVTIEIINGTEIRLGYDPSLGESVAPTVAMAELRLFGAKVQ